MQTTKFQGSDFPVSTVFYAGDVLVRTKSNSSDVERFQYRTLKFDKSFPVSVTIKPQNLGTLNSVVLFVEPNFVKHDTGNHGFGGFVKPATFTAVDSGHPFTPPEIHIDDKLTCYVESINVKVNGQQVLNQTMPPNTTEVDLLALAKKVNVPFPAGDISISCMGRLIASVKTALDNSGFNVEANGIPAGEMYIRAAVTVKHTALMMAGAPSSSR